MASLDQTLQLPLGGEANARRDEARHRAAAAEPEVSRVADCVRADLGTTQQRMIQTVSAAPPYERQIGYLDTVVRAGEVQYEAGRRGLQQLIGCVTAATRPSSAAPRTRLPAGRVASAPVAVDRRAGAIAGREPAGMNAGASDTAASFVPAGSSAASARPRRMR
jgi:hypothetical protein